MKIFYSNNGNGVLAQLEARIAGSDEVTGSNPVSSTNRPKSALKYDKIRVLEHFYIVGVDDFNPNIL